MNIKRIIKVESVAIVFICITLLTGCSGGAVPIVPDTLTLNLGAFPEDRGVEQYYPEVMFISQKGYMAETPTSLPPVDSRFEYSYPLNVSPETEMIVVNLFIRRGETSSNAEPFYYGVVELNRPLSEVDLYLWLDSKKADEGKIRFGTSSMFANPVTVGGYYELELTDAAYYLLSLPQQRDHIDEVIVTVLTGEAVIQSGPDIKRFYSYDPVKIDSSVSIANFDQKEFYICLTPSDYSVKTKVLVEVIGSKKVSFLPEQMTLIPTSDPELVYGLSKYNLYLINPVLGEIIEWKLLPFFLGALIDWGSYHPQIQNYELVDDDLWVYKRNSSGTTSYFVYDHGTGEFTVNELEGSYYLGFAPQHDYLYGAIVQDGQSFVVQFDLYSQAISKKWVVDHVVHQIHSTPDSDQLILVSLNERGDTVYRYRITEGELVCEEQFTGKLYKRVRFNSDYTISYWDTYSYAGNYIIARDVYQLSQVVGKWDDFFDVVYIDSSNQNLYQMVYSSDRGLLSIIDMYTKQKTAIMPLSHFGSTLTANADGSVVMEVHYERLIYHHVPQMAEQALKPLGFGNFKTPLRILDLVQEK